METLDPQQALIMSLQDEIAGLRVDLSEQTAKRAAAEALAAERQRVVEEVIRRADDAAKTRDLALQMLAQSKPVEPHVSLKDLHLAPIQTKGSRKDPFFGPEFMKRYKAMGQPGTEGQPVPLPQDEAPSAA
jgi:hypothetical protein